MTREDLDKLARLYANKSRDELSQMTVSYEAVHALAQEYLRQRNHQCQVCHHRWEGPCIGTYCGDCHRAAREATLKLEQTQKSLDALQRLWPKVVAFVTRGRRTNPPPAYDAVEPTNWTLPKGPKS